MAPFILLRASDSSVGWQDGGNTRGTWDIISSCLITIFAASWSVQHLNLPGPDDGSIAKFMRSTKWMVITILFPEVVILHAALELYMATSALIEMHQRGFFVIIPWWLRFRYQSNLPENDNSKIAYPWTLTHCYYANMGGLHPTDYGDKRKRVIWTASQIAQDDERNASRRPNIAEDDIKAVGKTDLFAKGVAVLQFLQLVVTLAARGQQGLAFSQLETVTLGLAVCGIIIYLLYFYKPQSAETAFVFEVGIRDRRDPPPAAYDSFWDVLMNRQEQDQHGLTRIPNDNIPVFQNTNRVNHPAISLLALVSGVFGALHAIAWNISFPTTIEKTLWRIATIITIAGPLVGLSMLPLAQATRKDGDPRLFLRHLMRFVREAHWITSKEDSLSIYEKLEQAYREHRRVPFETIFHSSNEYFLHRLVSQDKLPGMDDKFTYQLQCLKDVLEGNNVTKKERGEAQTNFFPRKPVVPVALGRALFLVTSGIYVVSRLAILGLALASLRKMPESVYEEVEWTNYFPVFE